VKSLGLIAELPAEERPRERLLQHGAQVASEAELIAILLRTGRRGASALAVARELLEGCGGLVGLRGANLPALRRRGLGAAKAATLLAALEIARRLARSDLPDRLSMSRPQAAARYLALRYGRPDQEVMGALYLDTRHRLIAESEIFRGTINRAAVEPRAILKEGLLRGATGFLLFHTHPSGDPSPSAEDVAFTRRLAEAGEIVGISLVDHLILGGASRWISLRERGAW
jgi:DNA repair protein RadC